MKGSEMVSTPELQWSIPCVVDGLNRGQRKILFSTFKNNIAKPYKVSQLASYAVEQAAYSNGQKSAEDLIVAMAQRFVGSNNINLLEDNNGPFGSRKEGGKDHGDGRHFNMLTSHVTRVLFPEDDDIFLNYLQISGRSIEPTWYIPIIPMILVNGCRGCNSNVPNYNPRDIIANLRRLLNGESVEPMDPWYKGFKGRIEKTDDISTYTTTGVIEVVDETRLLITELPINCWTSDHRDFLESFCLWQLENATQKLPTEEIRLSRVRSYSDDTSVHFDLFMDQKNIEIPEKQVLEKKFKLITTVGTTNMHLFDMTGLNIRKYETPEEILEEFFHLRFVYYSKRKNAQLEPLELALLKVTNKLRFIIGVRNGDIKVDIKRNKLIHELRKEGFAPFPNKTASNESGKIRATASDYEYLLSIRICDMLEEQVHCLCAEKRRLEKKIEAASLVTPRSLWMKDLDALDVALDRLDDASRAEAEAREKAALLYLEKRNRIRQATANNGHNGVRNGGDGKRRKPAAKKPPSKATTAGAVARRKQKAAGAAVEGEAKDSKAEKVGKILHKPASVAAEEAKASSVASPVKKVSRKRRRAMASTGDTVTVAAVPGAAVTRAMKRKLQPSS